MQKTAFEVPFLIRQVAVELAAAFYNNEDILTDKENGYYQRSDRFRAVNKNERLYICKAWPDFVPESRKRLAAMLNDKGRSEEQKKLIYEALLEDQEFQEDKYKSSLIIH